MVMLPRRQPRIKNLDLVNLVYIECAQQPDGRPIEVETDYYQLLNNAINKFILQRGRSRWACGHS